MSKPASRLLATSLRQANSSGITRLPIRSFSQTCCRRADDSNPSSPRPSDAATAGRSTSILQNLSATLPSRRPNVAGSPSPSPLSALDGLGRGVGGRSVAAAEEDADLDGDKENWASYEEPFHFHIYSTKHNTHVTVTKPDRNAILSISTGQLGFRKGKRGTYDAAYQLAAYAIDKLNQGNWHRRIHKLEVILRGFGNGREAATKVLLGNEGKFLRPKIVSVSDSTRLKFGGTRSKRPRRLG